MSRTKSTPGTKAAERESRIMRGAMPHQRMSSDRELPVWYGGTKEQWNAEYDSELEKREEAGKVAARVLEDLCDLHDRIK